MKKFLLLLLIPLFLFAQEKKYEYKTTTTYKKGDTKFVNEVGIKAFDSTVNVPSLIRVDTLYIDKEMVESFNQYYVNLFSFGIGFIYPSAFNIKTEIVGQNIGYRFSFHYLTNASKVEYVDTEIDGNWAMGFDIGMTVHIPLDSKLKPFIGAFGGLQYRNWILNYIKDDIFAAVYDVTRAYGGFIYGVKWLVNDSFYLEFTNTYGFIMKPLLIRTMPGSPSGFLVCPNILLNIRI